MSGQVHRRTFLKALLASFFLPSVGFARRSPKSYWFLHAPSGDSWTVADPVSWALANVGQPILECDRERLLTLDQSDDAQRVIRLVTRRCKLNLLELRPGQVVVHHWGQQGQADMMPFFKQHRLARRDVEVVLIDRKRETRTIKSGDDFRFGKRLFPCWPWKLYLKKWQQRSVLEADDWTAAPHTWSGFAWKGIETNHIPWAALKSAWRRTTTPLCMNCDQPTILSNFGFPWVGMFNRYPRFLHVCHRCRRQFEDGSVRDAQRWMVTNLD